MRLTSTWPFITLAFAAGCAVLNVRDQVENARGKPIITVEQASFDGESVNGRLLISSDDSGYVVIDRRLAEFSVITVDSVRDCDGGRTVHYYQLDGISSRPKPDELLSIEPGYWFGRDFSLYMYNERIAKAAPPQCVQVHLGLHLEAASPGAKDVQFMVQATLMRPDASTDAESPDAGGPVSQP